jgi:hypothetical protein
MYTFIYIYIRGYWPLLSDRMVVVVVLVIVIVVVHTVVNPTAVQPRNQQQPTGLARLVPSPRASRETRRDNDEGIRKFEYLRGNTPWICRAIFLLIFMAHDRGHRGSSLVKAIVREECVRLPRTLAKIVRRYVDDCVRLFSLARFEASLC